MTFEQQIWITLLDKGLLAAIAVFGAFLVNWFLQTRRARDELIKEIASLRIGAYKELWALTESAKASSLDDMSIDLSGI